METGDWQVAGAGPGYDIVRGLARLAPRPGALRLAPHRVSAEGCKSYVFRNDDFGKSQSRCARFPTLVMR